MNTENKVYDTAVIGAGASGLAAAVVLARGGKSVLVLEAGKTAARKILVSGNGRCNVTNKNMSENCYFGEKDFIKNVLKSFSFKESVEFFKSIGVLLKEEDDGRYFPVTDKATAVAGALTLALEENDGVLLTEHKIKEISRNSVFIVTAENGKIFKAKKLMLACGSKAYPQCGGTDSGYTLAQGFGHSVVETAPALSPVVLEQNPLAKLQGVRIDAEVSVILEKKTLISSKGEVMFTKNGLNGIPVMNVSRVLARNPGAKISLNLLPFVNRADFKIYMEQRRAEYKNRKIKDFFTGILHETIAEQLILLSGIEKTVLAGRMKDDVFCNLADVLQNWVFAPGRPAKWEDSYAAAGGVDVKEINPNTLESKKCANVYILGEMLDVDGKSGGFNLHFAFGCGYKAAKAVLEDL
ncbi:NAD(P)/FAD-dependent oxidoreductase [Elusimicrobium minutum]|nr:aminoacetone oxidase family FAD-binding enzyme [Elusimicrobium minutum]